MIEREDIIEALIARLATHSAEPMVSRDWRKRATLEYFPTIFIVERKDDVVRTENKLRAQREWIVSLVSIIAGSTGEAASAELSTFQRELIKLVFTNQSRTIGNYGGMIRIVAYSQVVFPPIGNNTVAQEIVFRVNYIEDSSRLFA